MKKKIFLVSLVLVFVASALILSGCSKNTSSGNVLETDQVEKIKVMVSVLPQVDFVERIGGDKVEVKEMIAPGFSPATYDPSPLQLRYLQDADIYFRIGKIAFELSQMEGLEKLNEKMLLIDTSDGVTFRTIESHSHEEDGDVHEDEDFHEEEVGDDPHIWLSPRAVKIQAKNIYEALVAYAPEHTDYFSANYQKFLAELDELDIKLKNTFELMLGETILVYHPAFGYLADDYGFHQEAIEVGGKEPNPAQLKAVIDEAKRDGIKVIFVQSQFSTKSAQAVAQAIDGTVVQIDPLAKDYFANLESMANTIINSSN